MKQLSEVINDLFTSLLNTVEKGHFNGCARIAATLVEVSWLTEFKDGIFIGEVFESSFEQLSILLRDCHVSGADITKFIESTKLDIQVIIDNYREADKNQVIIYESLKSIRSNVTMLQLNAPSNCNPALCGLNK